MAKLSTTSVFGDLLVDGMIHGNVTGNLTGNASTATSATTASKANILTTARNIALGGALTGSASFNGSANITINASVAKPPKSGDWFSGGIPVVNTDGVMEVGKYIDFHNTDASTNDYDVRLQANTSTPCIITLPTAAGTLARTSDNVASATKLQTPRTVNGTNFDGSANITTANWGTSRTLTIGNKGQSVNGSGNITWSTGDILGNATTLGNTSDWNTANATGIYEASGFNEEGATGANRPVGAYSWGGLLTLRHKNVTNQIYLSHGSNQMWIRGGWNGSFNTSWARVYTTEYKPTYSDVGAAAASHGTHVTWSTTTPKANGTATVGSETKVARGDHVHPLQTSVSGNAGTATKLATARTITIGNKSNSFNGSANISYTLADIGAAPSGHTHKYAGSGSAGGTANSAARLDMDRVAGSGNSANYVPGANRLVVREYGNDCTNMPSAHWYHIYTGQGSDAAYNTQLAVGMTTEALCFRNKNANTWGSWKKVSLDGHTHNNYATTTTTGSLSSLQTSAKGSLVAAINELFQSANNGKQLIASAIGTPLSNSDTFSAMSDKINSLLNTFKTNMMINGVSVGSEDKFKSLIDKIATLADNEDKGIQYAEGTFEDFTLYLTTSGSYVDVPYDLDFTPTLLFVKFNYINNTKGTTISNPSISNKGYTNFYMNYGLLVGIENISSNGFQIFSSYGGNSDVTFKGVTWYAIGVGEESNSGLDIISAATLPATGKENQLCAITSTTPNRFVIADNSADTEVSDNIVRIRTTENAACTAYTYPMGNIFLNLRIAAVYQNRSAIPLWLYRNNEWIQICFTSDFALKDKVVQSQFPLATDLQAGCHFHSSYGITITDSTNSCMLTGMPFQSAINFSKYKAIRIKGNWTGGSTYPTSSYPVAIGVFGSTSRFSTGFSTASGFSPSSIPNIYSGVKFNKYTVLSASSGGPTSGNFDFTFDISTTATCHLGITCSMIMTTRITDIEFILK